MYRAILFSVDGDWVTDCLPSDSFDGVTSQIADMGSRWIFYPLPMIIKYNDGYTSRRNRIISLDCLDDYYRSLLGWAVGKSIGTVSRELASNKELQQNIIDALNS